MGPLLQNLVLSVGDNEELCYCLKAWQALPAAVTAGAFPSREDALKARALGFPRAQCRAHGGLRAIVQAYSPIQRFVRCCTNVLCECDCA